MYSVNMAYSDKDSILEQVYKRQILLVLHYESDEENAYLRKYNIYNKEPIQFGCSTTLMLVCNFV